MASAKREETKVREEAAVREAAPASRAAGKEFQCGAGGLEIRTYDNLWTFSGLVLGSGMAPEGMRSREAICIAVQVGLELGLKPMQAVNGIAVINGKPCVWGDALLALVMGHQDCVDVEEWLDGDVAHCRVTRRDKPTPVERSFSMERAKRAGLTSKKPWQQYPERMLQMRARAFALRDAFPDILKGINMREEVEGFDLDATAEKMNKRQPFVDRLKERRQQMEGAAPAPPPANEQAGAAPEEESEVAWLQDEAGNAFDALSDGQKAKANGELRRRLKIDIDLARKQTSPDRLRDVLAVIEAVAAGAKVAPTPDVDADLLGEASESVGAGHALDAFQG